MQRKGRYNTSEKTSPHWIFERLSFSKLIYVARQEARHLNEPDFDVGDLVHKLAVKIM